MVFSQPRDLIVDQPLSTAISLAYQDECFLIEGVARRSEYRDRDVEPDDSVFVRIVFKYLGEASGG